MNIVENSVEIRINIDNDDILRSVYQTLLVEMKGVQTDRGRAEIKLDNNTLLLIITATDFVATRALTNSTMRLIKTSMEINETLI